MKFRRDPFQAIADPTRRAILVLIATHSMTAGAIASHFNTARPTISKHLRVLVECELITSQNQGREIIYKIKMEKMKEIDNWISQFKMVWKTRFNQLDKILKSNQSKEE